MDGRKNPSEKWMGWLVAEPTHLNNFSQIISPRFGVKRDKIFELPPNLGMAFASNDPFRILRQFFRGELAVSLKGV